MIDLSTPAPQPGRVLVVDDEPMVCRTVQRCVAPHEAVTCTSPVDALELLLHKDFDLILCDVMMPGLNGVELMDRAASARPGLEDRFVFMSGGALTAGLRSRLASLPNEFIRKPFELEDIRRVVDRRISRHVSSLVG